MNKKESWPYCARLFSCFSSLRQHSIISAKAACTMTAPVARLPLSWPAPLSVLPSSYSQDSLDSEAFPGYLPAPVAPFASRGLDAAMLTEDTLSDYRACIFRSGFFSSPKTGALVGKITRGRCREDEGNCLHVRDG